MVTVDFGACLSNYWFVWLINGLGSVFGLAINMAISFFFLKYFHSMATNSASSAAKPASSSASRPASGFRSLGGSSPTNTNSKV